MPKTSQIIVWVGCKHGVDARCCMECFNEELKRRIRKALTRGMIARVVGLEPISTQKAIADEITEALRGET